MKEQSSRTPHADDASVAVSAADHGAFGAYLRGELDVSSAQALEARLTQDDEFLHAFEAYARAQGAGVEAPAEDVPSKTFTKAVKQRIHRRSGGRFFIEDIVSSRFIPWFIVASFVLLAAVVVIGRRRAADAIVEPAPVTQDAPAARATPPRPPVDPPSEDPTGAEGIGMPVPAGQGARSGGPYMEMAHFAAVPVGDAPQRQAELKKLLEERFGTARMTEEADHFVVTVRGNELAEAVRRLEAIGVKVRSESREIQIEEIDAPLIRVYWR